MPLAKKIPFRKKMFKRMLEFLARPAHKSEAAEQRCLSRSRGPVGITLVAVEKSADVSSSRSTSVTSNFHCNIQTAAEFTRRFKAGELGLKWMKILPRLLNFYCKVGFS